MSFSYIKFRDGHRKSIDVERAHKLRAAMKPGAVLTPEQAAFIKTIEHVYITSKFTGQPKAPDYFLK